MLADVEKYRRYVDRFDLSDEQKAELIILMWEIVQVFADRALALEPQQLVTPRTRSAQETPQSNRSKRR